MTIKDLHIEYRKDTGFYAPESTLGDTSVENKKRYLTWVETFLINAVNLIDKEVMGKNHYSEIFNHIRENGN